MRDDLNKKYGLTRLLPNDPLVDPAKYTIIDGEYTVVEAFTNAHNDEQPLYYEPDGMGGMRFVYADKPAGRSFTV